MPPLVTSRDGFVRPTKRRICVGVSDACLDFAGVAHYNRERDSKE